MQVECFENVMFSNRNVCCHLKNLIKIIWFKKTKQAWEVGQQAILKNPVKQFIEPQSFWRKMQVGLA